MSEVVANCELACVVTLEDGRVFVIATQGAPSDGSFDMLTELIPQAVSAGLAAVQAGLRRQASAEAIAGILRGRATPPNFSAN